MYLLDDLGVLARTLYSDAFSELLTAAAADSFSGLLAATAADAFTGALPVAWAFSWGAAFFPCGCFAAATPDAFVVG